MHCDEHACPMVHPVHNVHCWYSDYHNNINEIVHVYPHVHLLSKPGHSHVRLEDGYKYTSELQILQSEKKHMQYVVQGVHGYTHMCHVYMPTVHS